MIIIKVFVPTYFDKFKCVADKCPDTCCVGWEVDIDPETAVKYNGVGGELDNKLKKHLIQDEDGCNIFTLCEGDRCPFLNQCNLCEIQLGLGEDLLSKTCTLFPRFFDDFGKIREMGLGLGCPEAARIILENEEPFSLEFYDECVDEVEDFDEDFLGKLIILRADIFSILEEDKTSFKKKIERIFDISSAFQKELDGDDYFDCIQHRRFEDCLTILKNMEYIKEERKEVVKNLNNKKLSKNTLNLYRSDFEKLMKYYIFRYLLKAYYDFDVITKVKYGVFACIIISRIYAYLEFPDFETRIKIMYSYSKEVEYSDINMDFLDEMLYNDFGIEDLIKLI